MSTPHQTLYIDPLNFYPSKNNEDNATNIALICAQLNEKIDCTAQYFNTYYHIHDEMDPTIFIHKDGIPIGLLNLNIINNPSTDTLCAVIHYIYILHAHRGQGYSNQIAKYILHAMQLSHYTAPRKIWATEMEIVTQEGQYFCNNITKILEYQRPNGTKWREYIDHFDAI